MAILQQRVVISQGDLPEPAPIFHLSQAGILNERIDAFPDLGGPTQEMWWTPLSNLPGIASFQAIRLKRPAAIGHWHVPKLLVRSKVEKPAKIAIQVFVRTADSVDHKVNVDLGAELDYGRFKLHRNSVPVTLTLPKASAVSNNVSRHRGVTVGSEIYLLAPSTDVMTINLAAGDSLLHNNASHTGAVSNAANARMILKCVQPNVWTVDQLNNRWTFS